MPLALLDGPHCDHLDPLGPLGPFPVNRGNGPIHILWIPFVSVSQGFWFLNMGLLMLRQPLHGWHLLIREASFGSRLAC